MYNFSGSKVFIAGGSSGIGLAAAKMLAGYGAGVIIGGRDAQKLEKARERIGAGAAVCAFDARVPEERKAALERTGRIHHLILALSGGKGAGELGLIAESDLRDAFESKFWTHFALARESVNYLDKNGSITFVTAISSRASNPGTAGLAAVNSAIEGLVRPLAVELAPLRINAVAPGVVDTPWWDWMPPESKKRAFEEFASITPVGRVGTPEDIAGAIAFLAGNTFMTGTVIDCDGGLHLTGRRL